MLFFIVKKRVILTQYPSFTGVGKHVKQLMDIDQSNTEVYSLVFKRNSVNRPYYGEIIQGKFQIPFTSGWYLNSGFQRFAYPKYANDLKKKDRSGNYFFHYSDFGLQPFTSSENSVLTIHDFFLLSPKYKIYNYKAQPFLKKNIKKYLKFKNLIALTKHVAEETLEYGFDHKPIVAYPYAGEHIFKYSDKKKCRDYFNLPSDKKLVLSISSNDPRKNNRAVIDTIGLLDKSFKLVRVGPPFENAYNFKNLSEYEINLLYNACDVFLFPTLDEGLGAPLLEAMAAGIPIVSSDIEAVREICEDSAVLVEPTPINISKGIKDAISNRDEYIKKGLNRSLFFSRENFQKSVKSVYEKIS